MNKKNYIILFITIIIYIALFYGLYYVYSYINNFSSRVAEKNKNIETLQIEKDKVDTLKRVLSKDSIEQAKIDSRIVQQKNSFSTLKDLEKISKDMGVFDGQSLGFTKVDNTNGQIIIQISAEQRKDVLLKYIELLENLPYVSHVQDYSFSYIEKTERAKLSLTLIIVEKK